MSDSKDPGAKNWSTTYIVLLLISVVLLVGGYFAGSGEESFWAHFLNEFGIAGIVAFVLALTIERLSAEEFRRRAESERDLLRQEFRGLAKEEREAIKKDVFYQTYGRKLPQDIRDELDHHVLQSNFIRSDLHLTFVLTIEKDPGTSEEYVKSKCLTHSSIENISGDPLAFPIEHAIDSSASDALKAEVKYLELRSSGSETEFSLNESDLKSMTRRDGGQISLDISKIPKVIVFPGKDHRTDLRIQYQGIRILNGGGIYFSFTSHTCDLDLTVHVTNRDLEVFAEAYSPHPLVPTDRHDPGGGYYNWTIRKPLLSYQSIRVTWKRGGNTAVVPPPQPPKTPPVSGPTPPNGPAEMVPDVQREGPAQRQGANPAPDAIAN